MLQKIKDRLILILLAVVGLLLFIILGREPQWVQEKEKTIKDRDKNIEKQKQHAENAESEYEEMIDKHDEEINNASQGAENPDFDNPDDAAHYIDDIISGIRDRKQ